MKLLATLIVGLSLASARTLPAADTDALSNADVQTDGSKTLLPRAFRPSYSGNQQEPNNVGGLSGQLRIDTKDKDTAVYGNPGTIRVGRLPQQGDPNKALNGLGNGGVDEDSVKEYTGDHSRLDQKHHPGWEIVWDMELKRW